ncbi:hypothetical protein [Acinetobacter towneri]|uniref:hypothetical protein n=1 Tax=Acinetobacter towneri TaxID=202956 RepID=UPI00321506C2
MKRAIFFLIALSAVSLEVAAENPLLTEFNKEIAPYKKGIKYNSAAMNRLADKELSGTKLTDSDYKKVFFLNCSSLTYMNKMTAITKKAKYKNLEKAKKVQKIISHSKAVMDVTEKDCNKAGMPVS